MGKGKADSSHERLVRSVLNHPQRANHPRWAKATRDALLGHPNPKLRTALRQLNALNPASS